AVLDPEHGQLLGNLGRIDGLHRLPAYNARRPCAGPGGALGRHNGPARRRQRARAPHASATASRRARPRDTEQHTMEGTRTHALRPRLQALAIAAALLAASAGAQDTYDGYLCCNMRSDGRWIS